jgi:hypothetical protein
MNNLINGIKSLFKKNYKKMNTERLISLKENFTGQKFQWIKTKDTSLRGKIVKCKDIEARGNKFIAYFNDGSKIDAELLNRNLMLIGEGMAQLSIDEINSINGPAVPPSSSKRPPLEKSASGGGPISMPDDLKQFQTPPTKHAPNISPKVNVTKQTEKKASASNMFSMFNADETDLPLNVKIKIPNKKLLKLMYENADNKNKFLMDLSEHVYSKINNNIVKDSLEKMLVPVSRKTTTKKDTIVISSNVSTSKKDKPIIDGSVEVTEIENGK